MARPGNRIPAVTLYADKKEVETAFGIATKSWICITCKREFSLLESMGAQECHQHPGYLQEDGVWSCCGKKIYTARWTEAKPITRMFDNKQCPYVCPTVKGCQKCDHKTSNQPYTHKDAQSIAELSALLPFLNKERPFILRPGFDQGVLRRCETRKIVVPPHAVTVEYQNNDGNISTYNVVEDGPVPEGIEIKALQDNGREIEKWH